MSMRFHQIIKRRVIPTTSWRSHKKGTRAFQVCNVYITIITPGPSGLSF